MSLKDRRAGLSSLRLTCATGISVSIAHPGQLPARRRARRTLHQGYGWSFVFQSRSLPDDIQPGIFLGPSWVPCSCYLSTKQTPHAGGQTLSTPVVNDANRADYYVVSFSASGPGVVVPNSFFDQNA